MGTVTTVIAVCTAVLSVAKIVVNLTPTEKDNNVFQLVDKVFNLIVPNLKKGGGTF
jgi:hypothetical protein